MKKLLLTLSVATAVTIGTFTGPKSLQAAPVNCDRSPVESSFVGPEVTSIVNRDGISRRKSLFEACKLQLHFLYVNICQEDSVGPDTLPEPSETETPDVSLPETEAPDVSLPETEAPDAAVPQPPASSPDDTQNQETVTPSQPDAGTPEEDTESAESVHPYILRIAELVNEERKKAGLDPLTLDTAANRAALVRAKEIVTNFSHNRPDGSSFVTALKEQGVIYRLAGENIAWGQKTPEQVMEGWMNSPGHRANILGESFTRIGVGYYQQNGVNYWTQLFY